MLYARKCSPKEDVFRASYREGKEQCPGSDNNTGCGGWAEAGLPKKTQVKVFWKLLLSVTVDSLPGNTVN